jgi:hypothetical protein
MNFREKLTEVELFAEAIGYFEETPVYWVSSEADHSRFFGGGTRGRRKVAPAFPVRPKGRDVRNTHNASRERACVQ